MNSEEVIALATEAKEAGSTRFCMGAAWREVRSNEDLEKVLGMVKGVRSLGLEVCTTLGMVDADQAAKLAAAGRILMNEVEQGLCFLAGANSIFSGDKLLTTQNTGLDLDARIFSLWGLEPMVADAQ